MSETRSVEVAIIGAGSAGMRAYREARKVTDSVLVIEGGPYGTTCARVGCMPSKLLIAAAEAAEVGLHAEAFGIHFGPRRIDGRAVMQRVRAERDRFVGFVVEDVEQWPEHHRLRGTARFISDHQLQIEGGPLITADRIVIATGSRPQIIPPLAALGDRLIVNDDVFDWDSLPESVAVIGAGVIGLELGQALHRLGVRVHLFGRNHSVGPLGDPAVREKALTLFAADFPFHAHAEVSRYQRLSDGVQITWQDEQGEHTEVFQYVLAATGRRPNVDDLGLENTSLPRDERGLPLFDRHTGRIGDSHVFIAGDANNVRPLLHEAADEGMIAGYNAGHYPDLRRFRHSTPIAVVFTDPQIMLVGQSYRELDEAGVDFAIGSLDWKGQGRARVMGINQGLLRVYGERNTGRFLGAEMIGPRAEHIAHLLAWSVQSSLTVAEMLERPFYHPVVEEGVRSALRDLNHALQMGPRPPARCLDCGPGS